MGAQGAGGKGGVCLMELGLHGYWSRQTPNDRAYYDDLGMTWAKMGLALDCDQSSKHHPEVPSDPIEDIRPALDLFASWGLRVVLDLRVSPHTFNQWVGDFQRDLSREGKLEKVKDLEPGPVENIAGRLTREQDIRMVIERNTVLGHQKVKEEVARRAALCIEQYKDWCMDWEFWGEWRCPYQSSGIFHILAYPEILGEVYATIKRVQPEARVWTGGNGMDLGYEWLQVILNEGQGAAFDVANWHPYFMSSQYRPADSTEEAQRAALAVAETTMRQAFTASRALLKERGRDQVFATTEWGYPVLPVASAEVNAYLRSFVLPQGVKQIKAEFGPAWYEQDLSLMEEAGFEVVIVHMLRDQPGDHWGQRCGLLTMDDAEKSVYAMVKQWGQRGREGPKAFAGEGTGLYPAAAGNPA